MSSVVIVAVPRKDDRVMRQSSEKVPHMTLLFLGETLQVDNLVTITQFVEHATNIWSSGPFMLDVDTREELGPDKADVLMFRKGWDFSKIEQFRGQLLANTAIKTAYDSVEQYEEWTPHLTMGYPDKPAKPDASDYPIHWVEFDRIALWFGDYTGPEFRLKYDYAIEEAPLTMQAEKGAEFLEHYGVKGMKWGQRKERGAPGRLETRRAAVEEINRQTRTPIAVRTQDTIGPSARTKTKISAKGGEDHPASEEAIKVAVVQQKLKKSGVNALTNDELREVATRLNLEQQVNQLNAKRPKSQGRQFVEGLFKDPAKVVKTAGKLGLKGA